MARASKRWRLDMFVGTTEARPPRAELDEALYALGMDGLTDADLDQIAGSPFGGCLVALVKHLARGGAYVAVELPGPSLLDDGGED